MRVAFIVASFPKLSETFILNQIIGLLRQGVEVEIFAYRQEKGTTHNDVENFKLLQKTTFLLPRFQNKYINLLARLFLAAKGWGRARLTGKSMKFHSHADALAYYAPLGCFNSLGTFDAILAHFGPVGVQAQQLIDAQMISGKLITVFHGYDISRYDLLKKHESSYKEIFEKGNLFLPISELWKGKLIEMGCNEKKIKVHRMGINTENFSEIHAQGSLDKANDEKVVKLISVARMTEKKGIDIAINALAEINKLGLVNFTYDIVGDGEEIESLKNLVCKQGLQEKVIFHGSLNSSEVYKLNRTAEIFILPSRRASDGDMEGIPVALMEAMWMRLLTISSNHSGIPELIENNVNGLLAKENDIDSLKEKIIFAAGLSEEQKESMRDNARKTIEERFNNSTLDKELYRILESLVHG